MDDRVPRHHPLGSIAAIPSFRGDPPEVGVRDAAPGVDLDRAVSATDRDNRRFGADRLHSVLAQCPERGGEQTVEAILDSVARHRWAPEAEDDYTLIVTQVH